MFQQPLGSLQQVTSFHGLGVGTTDEPMGVAMASVASAEYCTSVVTF